MRSKIFLLLMMALFAACSDNEYSGTDIQTTAHRVLVVMPAGEQARWERTAAWAEENIRKAQQGLINKVELDIEWADEDTDGWQRRVEECADDADCAAIIGPYYSSHAREAAVMATQSKSKKLLLVPVANSTELQRIYGNQANVWFLCQSNLTQCEMLLTEAKLCGCKRVSLIASDDDFGAGFSDWFAYLALELGLEVDKVHVYADDSQLGRAVEEEYTSAGDDKALLFAPGSEAHALIFDNAYTQLLASGKVQCQPQLLCADVLHSSALASQLRNDIYEGIAPTADPESGWAMAYESRFGEQPVLGEAHLYDAFLLTAYALALQQAQPEQDLTDCLRHVVDGEQGTGISWLPTDIHNAFARLSQGEMVNVDGVTGAWVFDAKNRSTVLHTTYAHWLFQRGAFHTLGYLSTEGGHHSSSTQQAWEWQSEQLQEFDREQTDFAYPALADRYAVVIATSDTWANYRHQADALAMYRLLQRHGYDEDHIIYITEDNIAYHPSNIHPGCVKVTPDGANLYEPAPQVDYRLSELTVNDLRRIMLGEQDTNDAEVLRSTENDNVIVFWCGHGNYGRLAWGGDDEVRASDIRGILDAMHAAHRYRKLMFVVDACYSGSLGEACTGVPGVLFITAANSREPSKADMRDPEMGLWLSNGFTRAFQDAIDTAPTQSLHELYTTLARRTTGSHATVYNVAHYGNMYHNSMSEFLEE